jgi:hypothetical protein
MNLRDAKAQIDREHPEMSTEQKIAAIRALRESDRRIATGRPRRWPLALAAALTGLMIWASAAWWHRHAVLILAGWVIAAIVTVVADNSYRRARERQEAAQRPV